METSMIFVVVFLLICSLAGAIWHTARALLSKPLFLFVAVFLESACAATITIYVGFATFTPGAFVLVAAAEIVTALVVTSIVIVRYSKSSVRYLHLGIFVALFFVILFGDTLIGKAVFYSLCARDGGTRNYASTDRKEGIFVRTIEKSIPPGCESRCRTLLGIDRYAFVEMRVAAQSTDFIAPKAGLIRYYLSKRGAMECRMYDDALTKNAWLSGAYMVGYQIGKDECIANVAATEEKAAYLYDYVLAPSFIEPLFIARSRVAISDRRTDKVLTESILYSHHGGWIRLDSDPATCP